MHRRSTAYTRMGGRRRIARGWRNWRPTLQFDEPINIQFTSGTTGAPKGATLTHHNILNNGFFIGEAMKLTPSRTGCASRCRCIIASAWCIGNLACTTHGAAMVLSGRGFRSAGHVADGGRGALHRRCTACRRCSSRSWNIRSSRSFDLSSLRTGIMAGAPCPIEVMRRCMPQHAPDARSPSPTA